MLLRRVVISMFLFGCFTIPSSARTICMAVSDASTGHVLLNEGTCDTRYTPASTFKIALSVMGYDAGYLKDAHHPTLDFKQGYLTWGGDEWKKPTDPSRWIKYSVVWYSQQITHHLGMHLLQHYGSKFNYGNADFSGDPQQNNGLQRSWIGSSLKISPMEQMAFLRKLLNKQLPASAQAHDFTMALLETVPLDDGWQVQGKTGSATPRLPDGRPDSSHPLGWYVGWAKKGNQTLVFAHLVQDDQQMPGIPGLRSRQELLAKLPPLLAALSDRAH